MHDYGTVIDPESRDRGKGKMDNTKMPNVKKIVFTAVRTALCVVLPLVFHAFPNGGSVFSPMHIPVYLCGLICGARYGLLCGLLGPLLSSLLTGMPGLAYMPQMVIELGAYGLISGLFASLIRTGNGFADLMISLISAMVIGRIVAGISRALIFAMGSYSMAAWAASYFVNAIPGIVLHLILVPAMIYALQRSRLVPERF